MTVSQLITLLLQQPGDAVVVMAHPYLNQQHDITSVIYNGVVVIDSDD